MESTGGYQNITDNGTYGGDEFKLSATQQQILDLASQTSVKIAGTVNYATWHTWEYVIKNKSLEPEKLLAGFMSMVKNTPDFGDCLAHANHASQGLRAQLSGTPGLEQYAEKVQILIIQTSYFNHCICALRLEDSILVMDVGAEPLPFILPIDGSHTAMVNFDFSGNRPARPKFVYTQERELWLYWVPDEGDSYTWGKFEREIPFEVGIKYGTFQVALEKCNYNPASDPDCPPRKTITLGTVFKFEPSCITGIETPDGWLMFGACRISISFRPKSIMMQVPVTDWDMEDQAPANIPKDEFDSDETEKDKSCDETHAQESGEGEFDGTDFDEDSLSSISKLDSQAGCPWNLLDNHFSWVHPLQKVVDKTAGMATNHLENLEIFNKRRQERIDFVGEIAECFGMDKALWDRVVASVMDRTRTASPPIGGGPRFLLEKHNGSCSIKCLCLEHRDMFTFKNAVS